jgi:hypothetical protein
MSLEKLAELEKPNSFFSNQGGELIVKSQKMLEEFLRLRCDVEIAIFRLKREHSDLDIRVNQLSEMIKFTEKLETVGTKNKELATKADGLAAL